MCDNQNHGSGEGGKGVTEADRTGAGWASPATRQDYFGWGRPSARDRERHTREDRRGQGRPPGRGTRGKRILFGRLPRLALIGGVS